MYFSKHAGFQALSIYPFKIALKTHVGLLQVLSRDPWESMMSQQVFPTEYMDSHSW